MLINKMEKGEGAIALDVERFSKQGTEHLQQGRLQQALDAFTNAHKSSLSLGIHGFMQRACAFNLGALYITLGRFNDGLHYLTLSKPHEGCKDGRSNGDLFFNFGLAYEGLKNFPESKVYLEKALVEYRSERSNTKMEADTTRRLGQLCVNSGHFADAEVWMKQLIQAYDSLGDKEARFQAEAERANLLLKMGKAEEAEEIADDCLKGAKTIVSPRIGNVFNELGLVYTQLSQYDKAIDASQSALNILQGSGSDPKLVAVLYQNMGALYNYTERFGEAIQYHNIAIEKHAELKNRKSQGHCFINQGFAYSQLNQVEKAGESFLHALQAAKDCGDKKSEWQSYEALGSVAYTQGDIKRAQEYYKQSLSALGQSTEVTDPSVQERVLAKLTHIIQAQSQKSATATVLNTMIQKGVPAKQSPKQDLSLPLEADLEVESKVKEGQVISVRRGSKIKHLRVRRSGTLRQFKKFALGLDISRPGTASMKGWPPQDNTSVLSTETIGEHEISDVDEVEGDEETQSSEEEEEEDSGRHRTKEQQAKHSKDIEEDVDSSDESGDDVRKVQAEMQKVASLNDADPHSTTGFVKKTVSADVHAQPEESDSETDSSGSTDGESTEGSDEEADSSSKHSKHPPPVPSLSPPNTQQKGLCAGTYETPEIKERTYQTIDHAQSSTSSQVPSLSRKSPGEQQLPDRRRSSLGSDGDGLNFFHSHDAGKKVILKEPHLGGGAAPSSTFNSTVYETMGSERAGGGVDSSPADDNDGSFSQLSRAQREALMYSEFKKDSGSRDKSAVDGQDNAEADQKRSKHCIVM